MYKNPRQWTRIRRRILVEGASRRRIARETGISRHTIRKILRYPRPQPYIRRTPRPSPTANRRISRLQEALAEHRLIKLTGSSGSRAILEYLRDTDGFKGEYTAIRHYILELGVRPSEACTAACDMVRALRRDDAIEFLGLILGYSAHAQPPNEIRDAITRIAASASLALPPTRRQGLRREAMDWIHGVQQGTITAKHLTVELPSLSELPVLLEKLRKGNKTERTKALVVLAAERGIACRPTAEALSIHRNTCRRYRRAYALGGADALLKHYRKPSVNTKTGSEVYRNAVFTLLHEPPLSHGINRTSWKLDDLARVLGDKGLPINRGTISKIIRLAGYRWRQARVALTSNDPNYREKLDRVREILCNLDDDEAFFSIDEYGPFAVKMKPGRALTPPGLQRVVPQFQKSKGCIIMTAALELSSNQVTHFYSKKKNTAEMIRLMDLLLKRYAGKRRIFLSWDAASWHISKKLTVAIKAQNASVPKSGGPLVETAPLPAGAQFLNVIESVFSGMSRAIIHNSNYATVMDAKAAINRYLKERNAHFLAYPQRAGKTIWGEEREPATFSDANNCKDPRYS